MAKQPKSAQFGQIWLFGRAWLVQPSEGHDETDFLGIKYCSTYKKVPKNPHFILDIVFSNKQSTFAKCEVVILFSLNRKKQHQTKKQHHEIDTFANSRVAKVSSADTLSCFDSSAQNVLL